MRQLEAGPLLNCIIIAVGAGKLIRMSFHEPLFIDNQELVLFRV